MSAGYGHAARPLPSPGVAPRVVPPPPRRVAVQPPSIITALSPPHQQPEAYLQPYTPASSTALNTPYSAYASPMALRSAPTMVAAYNPQEWNRGGSTGGRYMPHSAAAATVHRSADITGMEAALPSPPPAYSPGPSQITSQATHTSPSMLSNAFTPVQTASPSTVSPHTGSSASYSTPVSSTGHEHGRMPSGTVMHSLHSSSSAPAFPPPPPHGGRDRSSSRSRPDKPHSRFTLSALTSRNRPSDQHGNTTATDILRHNTIDALARAPAPAASASTANSQNIMAAQIDRDFQITPDPNPRPPATRRAASTGRIGVGGAFERDRSEHGSPARNAGWEPGMPLPPPPPGPPPSNLRSQSLSRTSEHSYTSSRNSPVPMAAPAPRRPPQHGTSLGPIPPTPADWAETTRPRSRSPAGRGLFVDTTDGASSRDTSDDTSSMERAGQSMASQSAHPSSTPSTGLMRTPAKRDPSARGIRERRSESRAARNRDSMNPMSPDEPSNNPWAADMESDVAKPANLVLPAKNGAISRRRTVKMSPRSGKSVQSPLDTPGSSRLHQSYGDLQAGDPGPSSSRLDTRRRITSPEAFGPTPPFSPATEASEGLYRLKASSASIPPKTLPTPPPQRRGEDLLTVGPSSASLQTPERPISHILHTPNEDASMQAPLNPSLLPSVDRAITPKASEQDVFRQASLERHRTFLEKEASASSDQERLELFAEFIVTESRIRRDRYSAAFDFMAGDILDLTRDMWRSYGGGRRSVTPPMGFGNADDHTGTHSKMSHQRPTSSAGSVVDHARAAPSPASSSVNWTPRTEPESPASVASQGRARGESHSFGGYQPCLSPIPSMNVSTAHDEVESRGRSASRWWEASADGSQGRGGHKIERSKRESKYMGIPREAHANLQWEVDQLSAYSGGTPGPVQQVLLYGPNEYPPEKVGWHEESEPAITPQYHQYTHSAPATPNPHKLDVSRLVTLPPPYPRHHPAVNNNHPDLASTRTNHRALVDLAEATAVRERYDARITALRDQHRQEAASRRAQLHHDIQEQIRAGTMSFADAAAAEAAFDASLTQTKVALAQTTFDTFKSDVSSPLHALFSERITKATACIEHLRSQLCDPAQATSPNQAQEEGDERPELLEKLTLLKWLFEAREALHRALFELEGEKTERYKAVVLTPYKAAGNGDKAREAAGFFARDAQQRRESFERGALARLEAFLAVVEATVSRGAEDQLSAFWDIAPGLLAVVQKVPRRLDARFGILIPPAEFDENPALRAHPLQYLHSLLAHAGKSAYQFIESQVNLLCLLHEVKTAVMVAGSRLLETQRVGAGEDAGEVEAEMEGVRRDEEERLTADLKEKVALVEDQWAQALGKGLGECKERVEEYLVETGGWDESLQE